MEYLKVKETADFLKEKITDKPRIGLILGSGLGVLAEDIQGASIIPYEEIPHFPVSTVSGHKGQLVSGYLEGKPVLAMQGRFHYYEGYNMKQVTFPVRVMNELGVDILIVTNAAGGIHESFQPGDLMLIEDHINLMGTNPLIGPNDDQEGPRFPDMSEAYDRQLITHARKCAERIGLHVHQGVYVGNSGPSYETRAEINMLRKLGGDAVGMSTGSRSDCSQLLWNKSTGNFLYF